jgi:hypothetical protein
MEQKLLLTSYAFYWCQEFGEVRVFFKSIEKLFVQNFFLIIFTTEWLEAMLSINADTFCRCEKSKLAKVCQKSWITAASIEIDARKVRPNER